MTAAVSSSDCARSHGSPISRRMARLSWTSDAARPISPRSSANRLSMPRAPAVMIGVPGRFGKLQRLDAQLQRGIALPEVAVGVGQVPKRDGAHDLRTRDARRHRRGIARRRMPRPPRLPGSARRSQGDSGSCSRPRHRQATRTGRGRLPTGRWRASRRTGPSRCVPWQKSARATW